MKAKAKFYLFIRMKVQRKGVRLDPEGKNKRKPKAKEVAAKADVGSHA